MGTERRDFTGATTSGAPVEVTFRALPERRLIRPGGSYRHVDFHVRAERMAGVPMPDRASLTLALVLDRSGSMQGEKIATAKRAALAVLSRLDERDQVALVVFDDRIDVVQPAAPVTAGVKVHLQTALSQIEARASTALHEGWLSGCRAIAADAPAGARGLSRCFLLTDGLANVGLTEPEQIASDAAGIRENAGISTSTFGIGPDYDEGLLGPMAVAGGGQFHHLRTAEEIASTFVGELGDLLSVAVAQVRLEIEMDPSVSVDVVSTFWGGLAGNRWTIAIGDLLESEDRHVVVRFGFPRQNGRDRQTLRIRLVWPVGGVETGTDWQEIAFTYADNRACDAEARDRGVMHWIGLHHADRAQREATKLGRAGETAPARALLRKVARRLAEYAGGDAELEAALRRLQELEHDFVDVVRSPMLAKEAYYQAQRSSRGQKDYRGPRQPGGQQT